MEIDRKDFLKLVGGGLVGLIVSPNLLFHERETPIENETLTTKEDDEFTTEELIMCRDALEEQIRRDKLVDAVEKILENSEHIWTFDIINETEANLVAERMLECIISSHT